MKSEKIKKTAIVTGASRGIGAAIAKRLGSTNVAVVVNYLGSEGSAEEVVSAILSGGGHAVSCRADISDPAQAAALFDFAESHLGGVDILVNNAGIMQQGIVPLAETDDDLFERLLSVNIRGTFNTLRLAAERLRDGGRIINLSSSVVSLALPGYSIYAGTKSAVETIGHIFAKELRGRNISVNSVAPGPTATDLFLTGKSPEQIAHLEKMPPLERLGTPDDIAQVVSFLAGPEGAWINGQTLRINGGII